MSNVVELMPYIDPNANILDQVRCISTARLKRMWDDDSGRFEWLWDEIHIAMNERGEGEYVAV